MSTGYYLKIASKYSKGTDGMTLLETMIALLVFSIGVLGVASMQVCGMSNNARALANTYDSAAACQYLETISVLPFDDPLLSDPDDGYAPDDPDHGPFVIPATLSTIEWEVDDQFPIDNAKRISVIIRRRGQDIAGGIPTYDYIKIKGYQDNPSQ